MAMAAMAGTIQTNSNMMATTTSNDNQPLQQRQASLSKRQRRAAGPNPSNTWQQQPRIKSAGARARAYISYAGLADDNDGKGKGAGKKKKISSNGTNGSIIGGSGSSVTSNSRSLDLLDPQLPLDSPEVKFGRLLGGTDQRSRHGAVKMLREYLTARSDFTNGGVGLSELDLLKLWKGMWYTLYMADKVPVQDRLSKILAELMWCLSGTEEEDEYAGQVYLQMEAGMDAGEEDEEDGEGEEEMGDGGERVVDGMYVDGGVFEDDEGDTMQIIDMNENSDDEENGNEVSDEDEDDMEEEEDSEEKRMQDMNERHCRGAHLVSLYISTFLRTVRREWGNVDKHRVDKFYTAVRYMVREAYKYMSKRHWNIGITSLFNDVLYTECLSAETPGLTNGLRYHLIDICVDELAKVNAESDLPLTEATFLECLEPFFALTGRAEDKNVQKRVMDNVLLKYLNEYSFVSPVALDEDLDEDEKALVFQQVHVGTVSQFIFEIASDGSTDERFRKSLYEMHKTYVRQIRAAGRDVDVDQCLDEDNEEDDAEDEGIDVDGENKEAEEDVKEEDTSKEKVEVETTQETPTNSEKKKKRKKKKNKDKDSAEGETEVPETPKPAEGETDNATTPKSKSKKKRKKKGSKSDDGVKEESNNPTETPETPAKEENPSTPKPKPSKKKRKKQHSEPAEDDDSDNITSHVETPKPKSRKKQKSPPSVDPRSMQSPDQVISPSNSDDDNDEAAATAASIADSASKRVSFGKMNHCKSYKASMKAIKTLDKDRWDTVSRTPDKGILRPKIGSGGGDSSTSSEKKKKKSSKKSNRPPLGPKKKKGRKNA